MRDDSSNKGGGEVLSDTQWNQMMRLNTGKSDKEYQTDRREAIGSASGLLK